MSAHASPLGADDAEQIHAQAVGGLAGFHEPPQLLLHKVELLVRHVRLPQRPRLLNALLPGKTQSSEA